MLAITVDPKTGQLLLDGKPITRANAYGTSGQYLFNDHQGVGMENPDDRYYSEYGGYLDEPGNWVSRWGPSEATKERLGGRIQLNQFGVGGYSEVKDPSKLTWDPEFGILTTPDNIADNDPGLRRRGLGLVAAIVGLGMAANAGLFGGMEGAGAGLEAGATPGAGTGSGGASFGSPGFGAGEYGDIIANLGAGSPPPASFGSPGFGAGESFFGADTLGLGGGGGALGTGTSLVGTGLGEGALVGELGSGLSLAGTGLAPGVATGTGAVAGGGMSFLEQLLSKAPELMDQLPGITDALGGGGAPGGGRAAGGGGSGGMSSSPGGRMAGKVQFEQNPYGKPPGAPNVLDLLSYVRGAR